MGKKGGHGWGVKGKRKKLSKQNVLGRRERENKKLMHGKNLEKQKTARLTFFMNR